MYDYDEGLYWENEPKRYPAFVFKLTMKMHCPDISPTLQSLTIAIPALNGWVELERYTAWCSVSGDQTLCTFSQKLPY